MAKISARKSVHFTEKVKQDFDRFGCTFAGRANLLIIDWRGRNADQALSADIFACLGNLESEAGPLVLIALEISQSRPLPHYCYFPFNLTNRVHRVHVEEFVRTGKIRLRFYSGKRTVERTHQPTPYLQFRAREMYEKALHDIEKYGTAKYVFEDALQLLERWVRIPALFDRLLSEDAVLELTMRIKEAVQAAPNENRELAKRLVRDGAEAIRPYYEKNEKTFFEMIRRARTGLTYIADLRRLFADNPTGFNELFADGIAASFSLPEIQNLSELLKIAIALPKLPFPVESTSAESEPLGALPEVPAGLGNLVQSMVTQGISKDSARKFTELIGLRTGGKSGRRPKDYSKEYDRKASGLSWAKVAQQSVLEDPDLKAEFRACTFDSLDFETREAIKHRIREGVKSYAKRIGKPFPPRLEPYEANRGAGEQKTI